VNPRKTEKIRVWGMKQKGICVEIDQKKLGEDGGVEGRERKKKLEILEKNISCLGY